MTNMKKVAVVILNFKVRDEVLECIKSVQVSRYKNIQIIVVDNNSEDGLDDDLKGSKEIEFIKNKQNLGYCGGNNAGIKQALKMGADYIFILNPDTVVPKQTISDLVKLAEDSTAGMFGPKILFGDTETIWYGGGIIDTDNVLGVHRGVDEKDNGQYDEVMETEFASGAAIFVKREIFEKIGFFDEKYFLYLEDLEFCYRAKLAGIEVIYNPKAVVYHKNARSTGLGSALQDYYITRNRLLFAFKYLSWRKRLVLIKHILSTLNYPTRRLALWDFLVGNLGKGSFND